MRVFVPVLTVIYFVLALAIPSIRMRRSTGSFGIVAFDHSGERWHRIISGSLGLCIAALVLWVNEYWIVGPWPLAVWPMPPWVNWFGLTLLAGGAALTFTAQAQMGDSWRIGIDSKPTDLVTTGLFRIVRNPIFAGVLLALCGVVVIAPAYFSVGLWIVACALLNLQVRAEERHLVRLHGQVYRNYSRNSGRFIPRLRRR